MAGRIQREVDLAETDGGSHNNKRQRKETSLDPKDNPYLAHMYEDEMPRKKKFKEESDGSEDSGGEDYGYGKTHGVKLPTSSNGVSYGKTPDAGRDSDLAPSKLHSSANASWKSSQINSLGLSGFQRHATTAARAKQAEDGPNNPFTGNPLSKQYFGILETRRGLPVHSQRYESCLLSRLKLGNTDLKQR